jgi:hypothetical protein
VGPVDVDAELPKPSGSLTPFWDQDGKFQIKIQYNFPLGIEAGSAWICVPSGAGQCSGPVTGTAKTLHGSGDWTWRPTIGGSVALYLHGCFDGVPDDTFISPAVVVQPDKPKPGSGGSVTFDFPSTDPNAKILISKRPNDAFASPLQLPNTTPGSLVTVSGTLRDATTGQPKAGTVYLQLIDPPDTAPYAAADAHAGDNHGTATFAGAAGPVPRLPQPQTRPVASGQRY